MNVYLTLAKMEALVQISLVHMNVTVHVAMKAFIVTKVQMVTICVVSYTVLI